MNSCHQAQQPRKSEVPARKPQYAHTHHKTPILPSHTPPHKNPSLSIKCHTNTVVFNPPQKPHSKKSTKKAPPQREKLHSFIMYPIHPQNPTPNRPSSVKEVHPHIQLCKKGATTPIDTHNICAAAAGGNFMAPGSLTHSYSRHNHHTSCTTRSSTKDTPTQRDPRQLRNTTPSSHIPTAKQCSRGSCPSATLFVRKLVEVCVQKEVDVKARLAGHLLKNAVTQHEQKKNRKEM